MNWCIVFNDRVCVRRVRMADGAGVLAMGRYHLSRTDRGARSGRGIQVAP